MSELDYSVEPKVECTDDDANDVAFVREAATIEGHDAVEKYVAYKMYLLAVGFSFDSVSKVETPLPLFVVGNVAIEL
jgi:hypothetical protein